MISLILIIAILTRGTAIYAEDCDKISDLDKKAGCLAEKKEKKEKEYSSVSSKLAEIRKKTEEVSGQINSLASQISITQAEVDKLQAEINTLEAEIKEINDNLSDRKSTLSLKEELRNTAIRNLAKKEMGNSWEKFVQASSGVWNSKYSAIDFVLDRAISQNTLGWIKVLNKEIVAFEADKKEALDLKAKIAQEQQNMLAVKAQLDNQRFSAEAKKDELKDKEEEKTSELLSLQEEIARLSEAQQAVLRMKSGEDNVSGYEAPS